MFTKHHKFGSSIFQKLLQFLPLSVRPVIFLFILQVYLKPETLWITRQKVCESALPSAPNPTWRCSRSPLFPSTYCWNQPLISSLSSISRSVNSSLPWVTYDLYHLDLSSARHWHFSTLFKGHYAPLLPKVTQILLIQVLKQEKKKICKIPGKMWIVTKMKQIYIQGMVQEIEKICLETHERKFKSE